MPEQMLSIVIPVYNEGENIKICVEKIQKEVEIPFEISLIYDFEEDTTINAAKGLDVKLIKNKYGKGALNAIKTGLEEAKGEYVAVTMADLSDPPFVINEMVKKALEKNADIVCASRYMKGGSQTGGPFLKGLMSKTAGLSLYYLAGIKTHDSTNSFKLYKKSFLKQIEIESTGGFELGLELVVEAHINGFKIEEVPTSWQDRAFGKSNFKLMKWLPCYLKWYFSAFRRKNV